MHIDLDRKQFIHHVHMLHDVSDICLIRTYYAPIMQCQMFIMRQKTWFRKHSWKQDHP